MKILERGMMTFFVVAAVAVLIGLGIGIHFSTGKYARAPKNIVEEEQSVEGISLTPPNTSQVSTTSTSTKVLPKKELVWAFEQIPQGEESGMKVTLSIDGTSFNAGTYNGRCTETPKSKLLTYQITAITCSYAGLNDEVDLYQEGLNLVIRHTNIGEDIPGRIIRGEKKILHIIPMK